MADPAAWPDTVDWSKTAARAMGAGHIYLSVRGRDPHGSVEPGGPYDALVAQIRRRLEGLVDPATGRRVIARVRSAKEAYTGAHTARAPDLVVSFAAGYGVSWDTMLGGLRAETVAPNTERWVAGHAGVDERLVPGVWLSTFPMTADTMAVHEAAPAILRFFGHTAGAGATGQPRVVARSTSRR
jgi:predicted AlkP superfamily phosphohydrolase/phosphomutase